MSRESHSEAEQRHFDRSQKEQQYSYDLTKQLTFYIISAELIFCGYILLNAEALGTVKNSSVLFLISGIAALCGLLWRYCYNDDYHANAHGYKSNFQKFAGGILLKVSYSLFIFLSLVFIVFILVAGFQHLSAIESNANNKVPIEHSLPEEKPNQSKKP